MRCIYKSVIVLVLSLFIAVSFLVNESYALSDEPSIAINEWEMRWEAYQADSTRTFALTEQAEGWFPVKYTADTLQKPANTQYAWVRIKLPDLKWVRPTLLISELNAKNVTIFKDDQIIYETKREYANDSNKVILPLTANESNKTIYIRLEAEEKKIGIKKQPIIGEYQDLVKAYMTKDIMDVILGATLIFISLSMLLCLIFMSKLYVRSWSSLSIIILSIGLMILSNSPFFHTTYSEFGLVSYYLFDISSYLLMPALFIFFESIFGNGPFGLIARMRKVIVVIVVICIILLVVSIFFNLFQEWYILIGTVSFGICVIFGNVVLISCLILYCIQRNKEAIILTIGFGMFAAIGAIEISWFFIQNRGYNMLAWKWSILFFIISLIIILSRRIMKNYDQVVEYSKRLDIFNNELQRSEKMEVISQLAASVAHEVRNPLQVTRGFLQLLGEKSANEKDKSFMLLAITELDRASEIITDFLTFAKPQVEQTTLLNIAEELQQIEGILVPLATMQGGIIKLELAPNLYIRGNSSKFKQALINLIKNGIEALGKEGFIQIHAYEDRDSNLVYIRIKDNGEGMDGVDLLKLGEPYYSKKTKGTGLGLMVTFRIVEAMQGKLTFNSTKGIGTEAVMHFPLVNKKGR